MRIERFHQNRKGIILRLIPSSVIPVVVILAVYSSLLYPSSGHTQKGISTTYTLNQIERFIEHYNKAQVVIGYELGEVNWSQRVLRTLGVGTHVILSPTGGWGEFDLEALAIERTRQKFERLSAEVFRDERELSRCEWQTRSKLFQSQSPLWMSDGSVHLPSMIRFEVFESCPYRDGLRSTAQDTHLELRQKSNAFLTQWLQKLNRQRHQHERAIAYVEVSQSSKDTTHVDCLQPNPPLYEVESRKPLSLSWRAVRWLWDEKVALQDSLKSRVKPSIYLGKVRCDAQNNRLILLNAITKIKLKQLLEREGGLELWIWIQKND